MDKNSISRRTRSHDKDKRNAAARKTLSHGKEGKKTGETKRPSGQLHKNASGSETLSHGKRRNAGGNKKRSQDKEKKSSDLNNKISLAKEKYYDLDKPSSYGGVMRLYRGMKKHGWTIKDCKEFLKKQNTYTLHKERVFRFTRNKMITYYPDYQHQIDLVDMQEYARENKGYKYILVIIDCFSRYCWLKGLKDKKATTLRDTFERLYDDIPVPERIQTDQGTEFNNQLMKKWYKEHEIIYFTTRGPGFKCAMVERLNRTLKNLMFRYFTKKGNHKYIDVLDDIANNYNNSYHRTIKMTPSEARTAPIDKLRMNFEEKVKKEKRENGDEDELVKENGKTLKVGQRVRVAFDKGKMDRGFWQTYKDPVHKITRIYRQDSVPLYELEDEMNQKLPRRYYSQQIQPVGDVAYRIERILRERLNKKTKQKEYFVKWLGYPMSMSSWVQGLEDV